jgi:hypothetical protein
MPVRSLVAFALVLSAAPLGCATMPAPAAAPLAAAPAKPPEAHHVYQLDFALSSGGAFTLALEEGRNGEIMVGANVPLQTSTAGASPRQDVGLKLRCSFMPAGDDLLLHTNLEMSSADDAPQAPATAVAIRKLVTEGEALVSPGKLALVSSVDDPMGHKHYQLTVTATKLR